MGSEMCIRDRLSTLITNILLERLSSSTASPLKGDRVMPSISPCSKIVGVGVGIGVGDGVGTGVGVDIGVGLTVGVAGCIVTSSVTSMGASVG